jgi:SAM-dependent methyltransferase
MASEPRRDLTRRANEDEWMDGDDVSQETFASVMRDLAAVNTLTIARRPTLAFVGGAVAAANGRRLTVLDVGFGAGDMLRALAKRFGARLRLIGIDLNPRSEPVARALTPVGAEIEYRTGDAYALPQDEPIDLIISSLVTHHMSDDDLVRFLGWMETRAQLGWQVNDLHRHALPYYGFGLLAAAMRWHSFVRHDGQLSIARAFTRRDWQERLRRAGIADASIAWWFPFRYCVEQHRW